MPVKTGKSKKIGSNKKSPACQRYTSENRWEKNKKKKQVKHKLKLEQQIKKVQLRNSIIQQCTDKYILGNRGTFILKLLIGTVNIRRMNLLLSGAIVEEDWFKNRTLTPVLEKLLEPTKVPKEYRRVMNDIQ